MNIVSVEFNRGFPLMKQCSASKRSDIYLVCSKFPYLTDTEAAVINIVYQVPRVLVFGSLLVVAGPRKTKKEKLMKTNEEGKTNIAMHSPGGLAVG